MTNLVSDHDLTHRKLDLTREDVRRLHPLLHLLDPEQNTATDEFAERLITALIGVEQQMQQQVNAFAELSRAVTELQQDFGYLMGEPEDSGSA